MRFSLVRIARALLVTMLMVLPAFAVLPVSFVGATNDPTEPLGSDVAATWTVTNAKTYVNGYINLTGNLIVQTGGNLTLNNTKLWMNCAPGASIISRSRTAGPCM